MAGRSAKFPTLANTLAYYATEFVTTIKGFEVLAPLGPSAAETERQRDKKRPRDKEEE
jgi:hypothetical protein